DDLGIETARGGHPAPRVADRDHLRAARVQEIVRDGARVAVALDRDRHALELLAQVLAGFLDRDSAAARRRLAAAQRAAQGDRLSGHDAGGRESLAHGEGVHDPRHDLRVGVDVGRGNVLLRPDDDGDLVRVAPGHALQLVEREHLGIHLDPALGAVVGQVDYRAFPGHPGGERLHLVEGHLGMEADASLGGPARYVVLHAVALDDLPGAVVHLERDRNDQGAPGDPELQADPVLQLERFGRDVELPLGDLERIARSGRLLLHDYGHGYLGLWVWRQPLGGSARTGSSLVI